MIISFSGFQSLGKTTATFKLANQLKLQGHTVQTWVDLPRLSPLKINEQGTSNTQWWISAAMIKTSLELLQIANFVVTDRTVFDCVAYEMALHDNDFTPRARSLYHYALEFYSMNLHQILWAHKGFEWKPEDGRSANQDFKNNSRRSFDKVYTKIMNEPALNIRELDLTTWDYQL